ncbi:hypothetical protein Nepgr_014679 [Nepenthes gracilis]|uniref:Uncharacterized protein n=1 Tax=Nepenthes gracilis TaxID=150966 RepID=A0AAD3XQ28_NEPGR|nr:hypothetical protein Nepgr_014679 [Nepenthes gracilis]
MRFFASFRHRFPSRAYDFGLLVVVLLPVGHVCLEPELSFLHDVYLVCFIADSLKISVALEDAPSGVADVKLAEVRCYRSGKFRRTICGTILWRGLMWDGALVTCDCYAPGHGSGQCDSVLNGKHHKRQNNLPSHNKPIRRQPPFAPIDGDQGGKCPWRVKSKPHPAIVPTGSVPNSNSFAALQCLENDTSSDPSDRGVTNDACNNAKPDLGPTLNGVETDLRTLNPSAMERVNRNESTRENEDDVHVSSDSVLRSLNSDTTLPDGDQIGGGEPASSSNTCNPSLPRSSRRVAQRIPSTLNVENSSHSTESLTPALAAKDGETPLVMSQAKKN